MMRGLAYAIGALTFALVFSAGVQGHAKSAVTSDVTVRTLAQGPVKALPAGAKLIINILEFRQVPGGDFEPPAHLPATIYTLHGTTTITSPGAASQSVGPGEAAFVPLLAGHTLQNPDGRLGAGALAAGLVIVVLILCAATWLRDSQRRVAIVALSILLVAAGILPLTGATSNDYYLIAARAGTQGSQPMPRPDGQVAYSSPAIHPVPAGPYVEALTAITVSAGGRYSLPDLPGPQMIVVVEGNATVQLGDQTTQLGRGDGAFAQIGQTLAIVNSGSAQLQVLDFSVTSSAAAPLAT